MRGLFLNFCLLFTENSLGIFHATSYLSFLLVAKICVKPKNYVRTKYMALLRLEIICYYKLIIQIIHVKQYLLKV